jgi:8-oxo-dGTP diphosphatase
MQFPDHIVNGCLCYLLHNQHVLLLQRKYPPHVGLWSPPGGKMEHGESPQEAVIREMFEETGLRIENPALKAIETAVDVHYPVHWLLHIFVATRFSGELTTTREGTLQWQSLDTLRELERPHADTLYWDYIIGKKAGVWQGKLVYDTPAALSAETIYLDGEHDAS